MKFRSAIEILILSGLVLIVYIRNDLIPAIGVAIAIILGRKAMKRYTSQIHKKKKS